MAIAQVGTANTDNADGADKSSYTATKPTGVVAGNVLFAMFTRNNVSVTSTDVSWIQFMETASPTNIRTNWYYRIATASEPANYTWTIAASCPGSLSVAALSGVDLANPICGMSWPTSTSAALTEDPTGPTAFNNATVGRAMYSRVIFMASQATKPILSNGSTTTLISDGIKTSGNSNRIHSMFIDSSDFTSGGSTKTGLAIHCDQAETENIQFTWVVKSADYNSTSQRVVS